MRTPEPSSATRELPRVAPSAAEEPAVEESLAAHARRVLRARLARAALCVLDPGIALLQWLRRAAGGAQPAEAGWKEHGPRKDRPGGRPEAAAAPAAQAPRPRRRLRAFLIHVSVLLAGAAGGGVLAYELLEKLLVYGYSENRRLEAALSAQSKVVDSIRQELAQARAALLEAQKKLAAQRAEISRPAPERQDKLVQSASRPAAGRSADVPAPPPKTLDCKAIAGGDLNALMDCIHKFNR